MLKRRASFAVGLLLSWLALSLPVQACGDCGFSDEPVLAPRVAASTAGAKAYYVEFVGRSSSLFGHSFVRLGIVTADGSSRRIMDYGLYPADNSGGKLAAAVGTRATVGYSASDVRAVPAVRLRHYISAATHRHLMGSAGRLSRTFPRFDLLRANCNHLTGHVARSLGLRVPQNAVQRGDDYARELKALNRGRH